MTTEKNAAETSSNEKKGIRLRRLNVAMIVIACILSLFLLFAIYNTTRSYSQMRVATERYIESQQDASDMQAGSDYLTDQLRFFVFTGETEHLYNYFEEKDVTRRRDKALESLSRFLADTESYQYLSEALRYSNELVEREYYIMRLAIEGYEYEIVGFPIPLQETVLEEADLALSPAQQVEKARVMALDDYYQDYKEKITTNVDHCLDVLISENRTQQQKSSDRLLDLLRQQEILIGVLLLMVFGVVILTSYLIIQPLQKSITHIQNQEQLPIRGAYELKFLAETYNTMYEHTRRNQAQLAYDATHDALTGLYNRTLFQQMRETSDRRRNALILVDLDYFKEINDTYGHDTGDLALKKVANLLRGAFRAEDYVCRIGGDEFAIIMVHATSELKDLVRRKIQGINDALQNPTDGLPKMSLSVGVAFSDRENPTGDIYKDADTALYRVKENGKNGCDFY